MTGIFITSTGTDIGKTHVACRLLEWDHLHHQKLTACKPIISGWPENEKETHLTDTGLLLRATQQPLTSETIAALSPWQFQPALSPDMAANITGKEILPEALIAYSRNFISKASQNSKIALIEGVGGVMVPLCTQFTVLDWITQIDCHAIVVVGTYLGTLSHTLTAIEVLKMKEVKILAVVVNETPNSTVTLSQTVASLQSFLPYHIIAWPYAQASQATEETVSYLYAHLLKEMKMRALSLEINE